MACSRLIRGPVGAYSLGDIGLRAEAMFAGLEDGSRSSCRGRRGVSNCCCGFIAVPLEDEAAGERGSRGSKAEWATAWDSRWLELDVVVLEDWGLSVPAVVVLPETALIRLPVGAPKEPRL